MYPEIQKYVNPNDFDQIKLDEYLTSHTLIELEVFTACANPTNSPLDHIRFLTDKHYHAVDRDVFLRRMPFYFTRVNYYNIPNALFSAYLAFTLGSGLKTEEEVEQLYLNLEYLFYVWDVPLDKLIAYVSDQNQGNQKRVFSNWVEYLQLCEQLGWDNLYPKRLNTNYNKALEAAGKNPIIYGVQEFYDAEFWFRHGHVIDIMGEFPCDDNGEPILKWCGVRVKDPVAIKCDCTNSGVGHMKITVGPKTVIHLLNCYNRDGETDDYWYQIYAGPQRMEFDYEYIQYRRKEMNLTQKNVADAIGTSVRTYQKWENGETTPDGHYLLRLMNWLDLPNSQNLVLYKDTD